MVFLKGRAPCIYQSVLVDGEVFRNQESVVELKGGIGAAVTLMAVSGKRGKITRPAI